MVEINWYLVGYISLVVICIILLLYFGITESWPVWTYVTGTAIFTIASAAGLKWWYSRSPNDGNESVRLETPMQQPGVIDDRKLTINTDNNEFKEYSYGALDYNTPYVDKRIYDKIPKNFKSSPTYTIPSRQFVKENLTLRDLNPGEMYTPTEEIIHKKILALQSKITAYIDMHMYPNRYPNRYVDNTYAKENPDGAKFFGMYGIKPETLPREEYIEILKNDTLTFLNQLRNIRSTTDIENEIQYKSGTGQISPSVSAEIIRYSDFLQDDKQYNNMLKTIYAYYDKHIPYYDPKQIDTSGSNVPKSKPPVVIEEVSYNPEYSISEDETSINLENLQNAVDEEQGYKLTPLPEPSQPSQPSQPMRPIRPMQQSLDTPRIPRPEPEPLANTNGYMYLNTIDGAENPVYDQINDLEQLNHSQSERRQISLTDHQINQISTYMNDLHKKYKKANVILDANVKGEIDTYLSSIPVLSRNQVFKNRVLNIIFSIIQKIKESKV